MPQKGISSSKYTFAYIYTSQEYKVFGNSKMNQMFVNEI